MPTVHRELVPLLDAAIQLAPVALIVADGDGRLLTSNRQWAVIAGAAAAAPGPDAWLVPVAAHGRSRLIEDVRHTAADGGATTLDMEMAQPSGFRWTRWWLQRREIDGCGFVVMAVIDVHDDVAQRDDLRQLATRDDLTGLLNRRFFLETVEQALRRAERFPEAACLLYVDLDGFKAVNDLAGHAIGDQVLSTVARRLGLAVRTADVVGRIGGDEFAVLIERLTEPGEAALIASRVQEALNDSVEVAGRTWPVAASVGLTLSRPDDDARSFLARADEAMYMTKRARTPPLPRRVVRDDPEPAPAVVDVTSLKDGVDTIRRSLETLLQGLGAEAP